MKKYCFGIDIGGTTVKCGLFETDGTLLEKWEIRTHSEDNGSRILPDVGETILAKMAEKNIDKSEVAGAGVGVPGPVHDNKVPYAVNLHWGPTDIAGILHKITGSGRAERKAGKMSSWLRSEPASAAALSSTDM